MQKFDRLCNTETRQILPKEITYIRKDIAKTAQPEFAKLLGVSKSKIQKWETGNKRPSKLANKVLNLIEKKGIDFYLNIFEKKAHG